MLGDGGLLLLEAITFTFKEVHRLLFQVRVFGVEVPFKLAWLHAVISQNLGSQNTLRTLLSRASDGETKLQIGASVA